MKDGIGARSWFCDPTAPWQKSAVENANKRIRRFMPGDTYLAAVSQRKLVQPARHLNDQPRKCRDYRTLAEVFRREPPLKGKWVHPVISRWQTAKDKHIVLIVEMYSLRGVA